MFENYNQRARVQAKNKYNHCGSQKNLRKKLVILQKKSHKKSPKLMVKHGTNIHDN